MDEHVFLRLIKVLLSSVLVSPPPSGLGSFTSCSLSADVQSATQNPAPQLPIHELLQCQSLHDFLDSSSCNAGGPGEEDTVLSIRDSPLNCGWVFWNSSYDRAANTKGLQKNKYMNFVRKTCSFTTFGQFISAWQDTLVSDLPVATSISIFREGIAPVWEAPENKDGGKFVFACGTGQEDALQLFFVLTSAIIAGKVGLPGEVCGIVVSFREWGGTIAVWNTNSADADQLKRVESSLSRFSSHHICYQPHKVSMQINKFHIKSKYRKTQSPPRAQHLHQLHTRQQQPQQLQYAPPAGYNQQYNLPPPILPFNPAAAGYQYYQPQPQFCPPQYSVPCPVVQHYQPPPRVQPTQCDRPVRHTPLAPPPGFDRPSAALPLVEAEEEETPVTKNSIEAPVPLQPMEEASLAAEPVVEESKQENASVIAAPAPAEDYQLEPQISNDEPEEGAVVETEPEAEVEAETSTIVAVEEESNQSEQEMVVAVRVQPQAKRRANRKKHKKHKRKSMSVGKEPSAGAIVKSGIGCGILSSPVLKGAAGFMTERLRFIVLNVSVLAILFLSLFGLLIM